MSLYSGASAAHMVGGVLRVARGVAPVRAARLHVVEGMVPGVQQLVPLARDGVPHKAPQNLHACMAALHASTTYCTGSNNATICLPRHHVACRGAP